MKNWELRGNITSTNNKMSRLVVTIARLTKAAAALNVPQSEVIFSQCGATEEALKKDFDSYKEAVDYANSLQAIEDKLNEVQL